MSPTCPGTRRGKVRARVAPKRADTKRRRQLPRGGEARCRSPAKPRPQETRGVRSNELVDAFETARHVGVSVYTVRRWAREGRIPALQVVPGGRLRFNRSVIDDLVATNLRGRR